MSNRYGRTKPKPRCPQVSDRLAERNRRLRQVHGQLGRIVADLVDTDLVRRKDR